MGREGGKSTITAAFLRILGVCMSFCCFWLLGAFLLERARQELAKVQADAAHAAEIAAAGRELMRQELARLTDQLGELKAALYKRAEAVVTPSPAG